MERPRGLELLLLSVLSVCGGAEEISALSGSDVTFTAVLSQSYTELNWFKGLSKIVDVERLHPPDFYADWGQRAEVDLEKATLTLLKVTPADSGEYRADPLYGGQLLTPVYFTLQVYDHVCPVHIMNTTEGINVTLRCLCSSPGAEPLAYQWYQGDQTVSENQNYTAEKGDTEQVYRCNASNQVSWSNATIRLPARTAGSTNGSAGIIAAVLIPIILIVVVIILYWCSSWFRSRISTCIGWFGSRISTCIGRCPALVSHHIEPAGTEKYEEETDKLLKNKTPKPGEKTEETRPQTNADPRENANETTPPINADSAFCCFVLNLHTEEASEIFIIKDQKPLMKIDLHSDPEHLRRWIIHRGGLRIQDVEDGDFGRYIAEVDLPNGEKRSFAFWACNSAQKGDNGPRDESKKVVWSPIGGVLDLDFPEAQKIIWKTVEGEDNVTDLLTVTYDCDPVLHRLALKRGNLSVEHSSVEDDGTYEVQVARSAEEYVHHSFKINVINAPERQTRVTRIMLGHPVTHCPDRVEAPAPTFDVTFNPVIEGEAEKITWKKDERVVAQWEITKTPQHAVLQEAGSDPLNVPQKASLDPLNVHQEALLDLLNVVLEAEPGLLNVPQQDLLDLLNVLQKAGLDPLNVLQEAGPYPQNVHQEASLDPQKVLQEAGLDPQNVHQEALQDLLNALEKAGLDALSFLKKVSLDHLCPVTQEEEPDPQNITQKASPEPQNILQKASLDPATRNLTLYNLQETDRGDYIMEAQSGDHTTVHEFRLSY